MKTRTSITNGALSERVFDLIVILIAMMVIVITLYPLVYVVSASFSSPLSITRGEVLLFPKDVTISAYKKVVQNNELIMGYANTIGITVIGTLINLIMTICCAYPLSKKDFEGHKFFTIMITFTMFFSAGMIPDYLLIKDLGLLDSRWALIFPGAISVYNMLIMRNFFQTSIPDELFDAAYIDGCNNLQTLYKIVLPLSKSIIAVMTVFYAVGHWNAYFNAMMYISSKEKFPLQIVLRNILLQSQSYYEEGLGAGFATADAALSYVSIQYAIIVVSSIPILCLYPFMQKYFVQGVMLGSIKG